MRPDRGTKPGDDKGKQLLPTGHDPTASHRSSGGARRLGLGLAVALTLSLGPTVLSASFDSTPELDVDPPVILVLPAAWESDEAPLVLRARIADRSGVGRVVAWIMGEEDPDYRPVEMQPAEDGTHAVELPGWRGRGEALVFFVEAYDRLGNGPRRSATPGNPFVVRVEETEVLEGSAQAAGIQREVAIGLLLAPLSLLWLMYRQERQQRARRFWVALLEPVAAKRGSELSRAIDAICARPHSQPGRGEVLLRRAQVRRQLERLRDSGALKRIPSAIRTSPRHRKHSTSPRESQAPGQVVWLRTDGHGRS